MTTKSLAFVLMFSFCGIALAKQQSEITGKELLDKMNSKSTSDQGYVLGFVAGAYAAHTGTLLSPADKELKTIIKAVKDYLEANPKKLNQSADKLLKELFDKLVPPLPAKKKFPRQQNLWVDSGSGKAPSV